MKVIMEKKRLDILLVERGLVESRSLAQRMVMAGQVRVDGELVLKASTRLDENVTLTVDHGPKYVSRGGDKLEAALHRFPVQPEGKVCADVGASTGGFTDCLLQAGALRVYAIDVGRGILDWKLRQDPRVVVLENTNARFLEELPEPVELITMDASFISLKLLLPGVSDWFGEGGGEVIALIKPQFEAGRKEVQRGKGVIRDPQIHQRVLEEVLQKATEAGFSPLDLMLSPVRGPKGNREYLAYMVYPAAPEAPGCQILVTGALDSLAAERSKNNPL
jgi:23S rRNA (cytidine1920-2'-O)/16S rRNA (cytidine1409-2'-O)-methyltransferase